MNSSSHHYKKLAFLFAAALSISACATVLGETQQKVEFEVRGDETARCVIYNDNFKYIVDAPGVIYLERSPDDLMADCSGHSQRNISLTIPSSTNWPNAYVVDVFDGAMPGFETDPVNGPFYNYPNRVIVDFDVRDGYVAGEVSEDMIALSAQKGHDIFPRRQKSPARSVTVKEVEVEDIVEPVTKIERLPTNNVMETPTSSRSAMEMMHDRYNKAGSLSVKPKTDVNYNAYNAPRGLAPTSTVTPAPIPMAVTPVITTVQMQPIIEDPVKRKVSKPQITPPPTPITSMSATSVVEEEASVSVEPKAQDVIMVVDPETMVIDNADVEADADAQINVIAPESSGEGDYHSGIVQPSPIMATPDTERVEAPSTIDFMDEATMKEIEGDASQDMFENQPQLNDWQQENNNLGAFE